MRFPTRLKYALRMLVELSHRSEGGEPVRLTEISKCTGVSRNYLHQLTIQLKTQSLLVGFSGRNGGYRLARPASEITILDVMNATLGPLELTECVASPESCLWGDMCECRNTWVEINSKINSVLTGYTVADLSNRETPFKQAT